MNQPHIWHVLSGGVQPQLLLQNGVCNTLSDSIDLDRCDEYMKHLMSKLLPLLQRDDHMQSEVRRGRLRPQEAIGRFKQRSYDAITDIDTTCIQPLTVHNKRIYVCLLMWVTWGYPHGHVDILPINMLTMMLIRRCLCQDMPTTWLKRLLMDILRQHSAHHPLRRPVCMQRALQSNHNQDSIRVRDRYRNPVNVDTLVRDIHQHDRMDILEWLFQEFTVGDFSQELSMALTQHRLANGSMA